ncbi:hypothetical protein SEA_BAILEYBLU_26 [Arthrobacter phage BaileyBlu]|uniref:Uncharacterized protein n=1 Tax=Arthrobacter phage BaileyBlu TaxID=2910754 RepID=A0AA49H125_9CAUD|nr:hypothetical protein PQD78_gp26 [Arthrobacter phage BaileyBlu]UJQ87164.1 hypothetical protein SEA_BAILEYBLU_26 [Arthrobacter phage BaileyBlu]
MVAIPTALAAALAIVVIGLAILLWTSTARHAETRHALKGARADLREARAALEAVAELVPEFRKAFPLRSIQLGLVVSGVNWANVRKYADRQRAERKTTFEERQLGLDKIAWENARAALRKGKK